MMILHFEALTCCLCPKKRKKKGARGPKCERCEEIRRAKAELKKAGVPWDRGIESSVPGKFVRYPH